MSVRFNVAELAGVVAKTLSSIQHANRISPR